MSLKSLMASGDDKPVRKYGSNGAKTNKTVPEYGGDDANEPYTGTETVHPSVPVYGSVSVHEYGFDVNQAIGLDATSGDKKGRCEIRDNDFIKGLVDALKKHQGIKDNSAVYRVAIICLARASGLLDDEEK